MLPCLVLLRLHPVAPSTVAPRYEGSRSERVSTAWQSATEPGGMARPTIDPGPFNECEEVGVSRVVSGPDRPAQAIRATCANLAESLHLDYPPPLLRAPCAVSGHSMRASRTGQSPARSPYSALPLARVPSRCAAITPVPPPVARGPRAAGRYGLRVALGHDIF